jgi:hypothetical protein
VPEPPPQAVEPPHPARPPRLGVAEVGRDPRFDHLPPGFSTDPSLWIVIRLLGSVMAALTVSGIARRPSHRPGSDGADQILDVIQALEFAELVNAAYDVQPAHLVNSAGEKLTAGGRPSWRSSRDPKAEFAGRTLLRLASMARSVWV